MFWLLEIIFRFLYAKIRIKQINDVSINSTYNWENCKSCQTQLKYNILRYDDNSYCKPCHGNIDYDSE